MVVNRSRYSNKFDWAGPKPKKEPKTETEQWRHRFVIAVSILSVAVVALTVLLAVVGYRYFQLQRESDSRSKTTDAISDTSSWKKYSSSDFGVEISYPADWTATDVKNAEGTNPLHVKITGTRASDTGKRAFFNFDVFTNANALNLADWVKQFGSNGLKTTTANFAGLDAFTGVYHDDGSNEDQTIIYAAEADKVYVVNYYQNGDDAVLGQVLADMTARVKLSSVQAAATPSDTKVTVGVADVVYLKTEGTNHTIARLDLATKKSTELFSDKGESTKIAGEPGIAAQAGLAFAVMSDGKLHKITVADGKNAVFVASAVTGSVVRSNYLGTVVGLLMGDKGSATQIAIYDGNGKLSSTLKLAQAVVDFAISYDGTAVAYIPKGSTSVQIVDATGQEKDSVDLGTANLLDLSWQSQKNTFGFTNDAKGTAYSTSSEVNFHGSDDKNVALTKDKAVQKDAQLSPVGDTVVYLGASSAKSTQQTMWKIGVDGKGDTNLLGAGAYDLLGFINK